MFSDLVDMMEHKRDYCKLRFTCKCDTLSDEAIAQALQDGCDEQTLSEPKPASPHNPFDGLGGQKPKSTSYSGAAQAHTQGKTEINKNSPKARPQEL